MRSRGSVALMGKVIAEKVVAEEMIAKKVVVGKVIADHALLMLRTYAS